MKLIHTAIFCAAAALAGCQTTTTAVQTEAAATAAAPTTASFSSMGQALNAARTSNGRSALSASSSLNAAAQAHANYMARTGQLTHTGSGGSSVGDRVRAQGCAPGWVGENVAVGQTSDAQTMDTWMASSGHRRNALNANARLYGVGQSGTYRVLVLAATC